MKTTFAVSTVGNPRALCMCLASVLNATRPPDAVQVRFEGKLPEFADFYLEQLSELARFLGVEWHMSVAASKGVRAARDWHLGRCETPLMFMGDDDVVYHPECLARLEKAYAAAMGGEQEAVYFCGSKGDLNNRRGYGDFDTKVHSTASDNSNFNWFYDIEKLDGKTVKTTMLDTGCVLFDVLSVRRNGLKFSVFPDSINAGGEDTLFALRCAKLGLGGFFVPSARAYHMEKPRVNFGEFEARGEMLLRACDVLGLGKESLKKHFMPWLFPK